MNAGFLIFALVVHIIVQVPVKILAIIFVPHVSGIVPLIVLHPAEILAHGCLNRTKIKINRQRGRLSLP
jgi:hypothetical protein